MDPEKPVKTKLRIVVEAHCEEREPIAYAAMLKNIRATYWLKNLEKDVKEFTQTCIQCIIARNEKRILLPLALALEGKRPNEVIHMYFLYMGLADESTVKYVLLIKDGFSSNAWLYPTKDANSDVAASAISKWITCFSCM